MSYELKIKDVKTASSQADNIPFFDVTVDVLKDGEVVGERKFGFPLSHTSEEILAELAKTATTLEGDDAIAADTVAREAAMAKANDVISELLPKKEEGETE